MDSITWPVVATILGTLVALLAFLYNMLKRTNDPWKNDMKTDTALIKQEIETLKSQLEEQKKYIDNVEKRTNDTINKFEERMEKFTNIIIENLRN